MEKGTLNTVKLTVSGIVGPISAWLGGLAYPVYVLVFLNVADYVTGITAAKYRGQKRSSQAGLLGIAKKVYMLLLVFLGWVVDWLLTYAADTVGLQHPARSVVASVVAVWLICNELISILENIGDIGVKLPPILTRMVRWVQCELESPGQCPGPSADPACPLGEQPGAAKIEEQAGQAGEERPDDDKGASP